MTTVVLVEDSRLLRVATERVLSKAGYTVICACDGDEARALAYVVKGSILKDPDALLYAIKTAVAKKTLGALIQASCNKGSVSN